MAEAWNGILGYILGLSGATCTFAPELFRLSVQDGHVAVGTVAALTGAVAVYNGLFRKKQASQAYLISTALGALSSTGIMLAIYRPEHWRFGAYLGFMGFFHCSEYVMTALYNRDVLSFDSFLINHSRSYHVAALSCCIEYYLEMRYCPIIKSLNIISYAGLAMVGLGEAFRKLAMWTAGSNFKHIVATNKLESHELVTTGIYSLCRHPAYAGWFWWAVGTQVLLCNPFCSIAYGWAAYRFFADRLEYEEYHLLLFFGTQYHRYQQRVPTGVPFVQGYVAREQLLSYLTAREQSAATSS